MSVSGLIVVWYSGTWLLNSEFILPITLNDKVFYILSKFLRDRSDGNLAEDFFL